MGGSTDRWSQRHFDFRSLSLKSSWLTSQSIVAVAEASRQSGNPEEREHAPLEAIARRLVTIRFKYPLWSSIQCE
jgi:hypothetical protein